MPSSPAWDLNFVLKQLDMNFFYSFFSDPIQIFVLQFRVFNSPTTYCVTFIRLVGVVLMLAFPCLENYFPEFQLSFDLWFRRIFYFLMLNLYWGFPSIWKRFQRFVSHRPQKWKRFFQLYCFLKLYNQKCPRIVKDFAEMYHLTDDQSAAHLASQLFLARLWFAMGVGL